MAPSLNRRIRLRIAHARDTANPASTLRPCWHRFRHPEQREGSRRCKGRESPPWAWNDSPSSSRANARDLRAARRRDSSPWARNDSPWPSRANAKDLRAARCRESSPWARNDSPWSSRANARDLGVASGADSSPSARNDKSSVAARNDKSSVAARNASGGFELRKDEAKPGCDDADLSSRANARDLRAARGRGSSPSAWNDSPSSSRANARDLGVASGADSSPSARNDNSGDAARDDEGDGCERQAVGRVAKIRNARQVLNPESLL